MFELKPLSPSAIPAALAKAERYRLLNEPEQAQSICEDILAAEPDHRRCADRMLMLALTDRFPYHDGRLVSRAQAVVARLEPSTTAPTTAAWCPSAAPARCSGRPAAPRSRSAAG